MRFITLPLGFTLVGQKEFYYVPFRAIIIIIKTVEKCKMIRDMTLYLIVDLLVSHEQEKMSNKINK